jgi:hypothetical protein
MVWDGPVIAALIAALNPVGNLTHRANAVNLALEELEFGSPWALTASHKFSGWVAHVNAHWPRRGSMTVYG